MAWLSRRIVTSVFSSLNLVPISVRKRISGVKVNLSCEKERGRMITVVVLAIGWEDDELSSAALREIL